MTRFNGDKLRVSAVIFMIAYSIMPFVSVAVSAYLTTYFYMVLSVLLLILIVMERRLASFNEVIATAGPFWAYGFLTYFTNPDSVVLWGYKFLLFIMPLIVSAYIIRYHEEECNKYARAIVLCIMITIITTSVGLEANPGASRWLATAQSSSDPRLTGYSWKNIGGYDFVYTLVLMYPILVLAYKKKKISLFKTVLIASLIFSCLILAEYTIALILFIATTILFFMKKDLKTKDITFFLIVTVLTMFIFSSAMSNILRGIASNVESEIMSMRLNDLAGGASVLQKSEDNRLDLYMMSLNTFFHHPFGTFINGGGGIGGHSFTLDALGQYGILGLLVLIYMYRKLYYLFYHKYSKKADFGYTMWVFSQAVFLSTINTGMWVDILSFYIPVVLCTLYDDTSKEPVSEIKNHN